MKITRALTGTLVGTLAMIGVTAAPSLAASSSVKPHISQVDKTVTFDGTNAYVTGTFRCPDNGEHLHVWVSVKQGDDVKAHSTSEDAESWYDAHPGESDSQPVPCDGEWHTVTYALSLHDPWFTGGQSWSALQEGDAWIQFCLVNGAEIVTSMSRWGTVVAD